MKTGKNTCNTGGYQQARSHASHWASLCARCGVLYTGDDTMASDCKGVGFTKSRVDVASTGALWMRGTRSHRFRSSGRPHEWLARTRRSHPTRRWRLDLGGGRSRAPSTSPHVTRLGCHLGLGLTEGSTQPALPPSVERREIETRLVIVHKVRDIVVGRVESRPVKVGHVEWLKQAEELGSLIPHRPGQCQRCTICSVAECVKRPTLCPVHKTPRVVKSLEIGKTDTCMIFLDFRGRVHSTAPFSLLPSRPCHPRSGGQPQPRSLLGGSVIPTPFPTHPHNSRFSF